MSHLNRIVAGARCVLVDLPESLLFSSIYLSVLFPDRDNVIIGADNLADLEKTTPGFTFVPNYLFPILRKTKLKFDLAINTLSMSEMAEQQVRDYCTGIAELLGRHGVFFEQNQDNRAIGHQNAQLIVSDYFPYRLQLGNSLPAAPAQGRAHLWTMTVDALRRLEQFRWLGYERRLARRVAAKAKQIYRRLNPAR